MADDKPQPIPRKTPKKRSGPSMREQILARRRAEEAGGADAPAAKPAAAKSARKAAAPKAAAPRAERPARGAAKPTSRTGARRAGAGRATTGDDDAGDGGEGRRSRRGRPEPKKKSPLPLIAAAVVAIGGVGGYFIYTGTQSDAAETEDGQTPDTDTANANGETPEGADGAGDGSTDGDTAPAAEGADEGTPEGAATPEPAAEKPTPKKKGLVGKTTEELVAMVAALEPFPKPTALTDEEWAEMNKDADLVFEDAGAASGRAEKRLGVDGNQYAWPLMINRMAKIDFGDEYQVQSGMAAQRVMQMARGSKNMGGMGWMTAAETKDGEFNDRAHRKDLMLIIKAHESWTTATQDPEWWPKKLYKGEMYKEAEALKANRIEGELEGLDNLDVDDLDLDDIDLDDGE